MPRLTGSSVLSFVAVLALIGGLGLLATAAWTQPLSEAAAAERAGHRDLAVERYVTAEKRFDSIPVAKQLLPAAYQASIANQLQLQYQAGEYDKVIEKAALSPSTAAIHFWAGCALFQKGLAEKKREEAVTWLNRAQGEFRKVLEREPDDWDAKFDYELTGHLLRELQPDKLPPPEKLIPLLRPQPAPQEPDRRVP